MIEPSESPEFEQMLKEVRILGAKEGDAATYFGQGWRAALRHYDAYRDQEFDKARERIRKRNYSASSDSEGD